MQARKESFFENIINAARESDEKQLEHLKKQAGTIDAGACFKVESDKFPYIITPASLLAEQGETEAALRLLEKGASLGPILFSLALKGEDLSALDEIHLDDGTREVFELLARMYHDNKLLPPDDFPKHQLFNYSWSKVWAFKFSAKHTHYDWVNYPVINNDAISHSENPKILAFMILIKQLVKLGDHQIVNALYRKRGVLFEYLNDDNYDGVKLTFLMACSMINGAVQGEHLTYIAQIFNNHLRSFWEAPNFECYRVIRREAFLKWLFESGLVDQFCRIEGNKFVNFAKVLWFISQFDQGLFSWMDLRFEESHMPSKFDPITPRDGSLQLKVAAGIELKLENIFRGQQFSTENYPFSLALGIPEDEFSLYKVFRALRKTADRIHVISTIPGIDHSDAFSYEAGGNRALEELLVYGEDNLMEVPVELCRLILQFSGHISQIQGVEQKIEPLDSIRPVKVNLLIKELIDRLKIFTASPFWKTKTPLQKRAAFLIKQIYFLRQEHQVDPNSLKDNIINLLHSTINALSSIIPEEKHEQAVINNNRGSFYSTIKKYTCQIENIKEPEDIKQELKNLIDELEEYTNSWSCFRHHRKRAKSLKTVLKDKLGNKNLEELPNIMQRQLGFFERPWQAPRDDRDTTKNIDDLVEKLKSEEAAFRAIP